jgi:hypothetical protein
MRRSLALALLCFGCACAQRAGIERLAVKSPTPMVASADSLAPVDRARIVEAAVRFRGMIFLDDTTARLDGCSVVHAVGEEYRTLLARDIRRLVSEPTSACGGTSVAPRFTPRLVVRGIQGGAGEAVIRITYEGGSYIHEEEFKVRKASSRGDGFWVATEMRVYDAMIAD